MLYYITTVDLGKEGKRKERKSVTQDNKVDDRKRYGIFSDQVSSGERAAIRPTRADDLVSCGVNSASHTELDDTCCMQQRSRPKCSYIFCLLLFQFICVFLFSPAPEISSREGHGNESNEMSVVI